jgi:hypothetical protein
MKNSSTSHSATYFAVPLARYVHKLAWNIFTLSRCQDTNTVLYKKSRPSVACDVIDTRPSSIYDRNIFRRRTMCFDFHVNGAVKWMWSAPIFKWCCTNSK